MYKEKRGTYRESIALLLAKQMCLVEQSIQTMSLLAKTTGYNRLKINK